MINTRFWIYRPLILAVVYLFLRMLFGSFDNILYMPTYVSFSAVVWAIIAGAKYDNAFEKTANPFAAYTFMSLNTRLNNVQLAVLTWVLGTAGTAAWVALFNLLSRLRYMYLQ